MYYGKKKKKNGDRIFLLSHRKKKVISYIRELKKLLKKEHYDIMHVHGNSALMEIELFAAKHDKCKKVVHAHSTQCTYKLFHKILYKSFLQDLDYALACSEDAGKWLYQDNVEYKVLINGINPEKYVFNEDVRKKVRKELRVENEIVIGHVGNFVEIKNHHFLIDVFEEAVKIDHRSRLILIGEGKLKEKIETYVASKHLEDKVIFTGSTPKVDRYLQSMDVFILPSLQEGFPVSAIEAQAAGLPCVFSGSLTRKMKITEDVEYLDFSLGTKRWAEITLQMAENSVRKNQVEKIREAGLDIRSEAENLRRFYQDIVSGESK